MYGSVTEKDPISNLSIPLVTNISSITCGYDDETFLENPFNEVFDNNFWNKVTNAYSNGMAWADALNKVRINIICEDFIINNKDPLVSMLTEVYDKFKKHSKEPQVMSAFRLQLLEFVKIILHDDYSSSSSQEERKYAWLLPVPNQGRKTILHLAAERNLQDIAQVFIKMYPGLVYEPTSDSRKLPLELALELIPPFKCRHDEVASLLIKSMLHQRVRHLFESSDVMNASLKLADIVSDPTLKRTIPAILDCLINADWPFFPLKNPEKSEEEWSEIPNLPTRYHFHYRLLDGDQNSEPARKDNKPNVDFDYRSPSCLQLLVEGAHSEIAVRHPVVRMLVNRKWEKFGKKMIRMNFVVYIVFLLFMSLAFFGLKKMDTFSTVCEIVTLVFTVGYMISEVDQMEKERIQYFKDVFNYLDVLGLVLILSMVPLRISGYSKSELSVAAVAYLINFLRVFKYFPAFKYIGLYSKTFANIIYYDISKFAIVYAIVAIAFTGSVFLSLNATLTTNTINEIGFWKVLLKEVRALAESSPFNDDYSNFHAGVVILIMINMFSIIVILSNILIGQLSNRYSMAVEEAEIQYSIDKTKFITRLEKSRFRFFNARIAHYVDGDYVSDESLVKDLLNEWNKSQSLEDADTAAYIRKRIEKMLKTKDKND
ncbi:uncharacterized protein LOC100201836 isoform X2 [Hydra vulgaris]|uniref:Uncharacterized protein LOC100201836 isoform X2 n=1 Tax=Hydra vulgaris TaxID=6087 RepID=A0ABM4CSW3_HYDVU